MGKTHLLQCSLTFLLANLTIVVGIYFFPSNLHAQATDFTPPCFPPYSSCDPTETQQENLGGIPLETKDEIYNAHAERAGTFYLIRTQEMSGQQQFGLLINNTIIDSDEDRILCYTIQDLIDNGFQYNGFANNECFKCRDEKESILGIIRHSVHIELCYIQNSDWDSIFQTIREVGICSELVNYSPEQYYCE